MVNRYSNMDYIFFSAVVGLSLLFLSVSYDLSCQWKKNLFSRMLQLLEELHIDTEAVKVQFGLPTWHAHAHEMSCQMENALNLQEGVGRTDGVTRQIIS